MTRATGAIATLGGETMGTTWSVRLVAPARTDLHALHAAMQARLDLVVRQMSTWEPGSDITRFNHADAGTWHVLPAEFAQVLACALEIAEASDGAFDPSLGALVGLWGFGADAQARTPPEAARLQQAQADAGWRRITVDAGLRVRQPGGLRLDLSAIAKGHGVDLVAARLRAAGIPGALVEVGGELYGYGRKPDGTGWRVLVEAGDEADDAHAEPRVLALDGIAVATSGDRWHRYQHAGRRYSHTLDPRSGRPVEHAPVAVSVVAADAMHADAWATALTVPGADAGLALAQQRGLAARFVERTDGGVRERMTDAFRQHLAA